MSSRCAVPTVDGVSRCSRAGGSSSRHSSVAVAVVGAGPADVERRPAGARPCPPQRSRDPAALIPGEQCTGVPGVTAVRPPTESTPGRAVPWAATGRGERSGGRTTEPVPARDGAGHAARAGRRPTTLGVDALVQPALLETWLQKVEDLSR
jgi:hypothetical protein